MKKTAYSLFVLAIVLITSFGCKKSNSNISFAVDNKYGPVAMNVDIYTSKQDYINRTNVLEHATIDSGDSHTFTASYLNPGNWYYVDAYSSDYSYTNWVLGDDMILGEDSVSALRFKYNSSDNRFIIHTIHTMARNVLINNNYATANWRAIDALDVNDGSSTWGAMTTAQKDLEIVLTKQHTGEYRFRDSVNVADTMRFSYLNTVIKGYPFFKLPVGDSVDNVYIENANLHPLINSDRRPTRDTILSLYHGFMYLLVRE